MLIRNKVASDMNFGHSDANKKNESTNNHNDSVNKTTKERKDFIKLLCLNCKN